MKTNWKPAWILLAIAAWLLGYLAGSPTDVPTIGGRSIPAEIDCHENEVIGYDVNDLESPRSIACIHVDNFPHN